MITSEKASPSLDFESKFGRGNGDRIYLSAPECAYPLK